MCAQRTVHLIDSLPFIYKAYHGHPGTAGAALDAVPGFAQFLVRYLGLHEPTHVAACFDKSSGTSFRHEVFPGYKGSRGVDRSLPTEQRTDCEQLAKALGLRVFAHARFEADDIVGTICRRMRREGHKVVVVTTDKDLFQLVDEHVECYDFSTGRRYDADAVHSKLGVRPAQVPDFLGLSGDSSDSIPGVKGVGPKTAAALLAEYDDLEDLYGSLGQVRWMPIRGAKTLAAKLKDGEDQAFRSRSLATLCYDAPVAPRVQELEWRGASRAMLEPILQRLADEDLPGQVTRWNDDQQSMAPRASE